MAKRNQKWQAVAVKQTIKPKAKATKPTKTDQQIQWAMWGFAIIGLILMGKGVYLSTQFAARPQMDVAVPFLLVFFGYLSLSMGCELAVERLLPYFKVEKPYQLKGWRRFWYDLCLHLSVVARLGFSLVKKMQSKKNEK